MLLFVKVLLGFTIASYGLAAGFYLWHLHRGADMPRRFATPGLLLALVAHSAYLCLHGVMQHQMPFINLFGALVFFAWFLALIYLAIELRFRTTILGAFACLLAVVILSTALCLPRGISETLLPALKSHWSGVHIVSSLLGYASFTLAFGAAISYILQERLLKARRIGIFQQHLPPLETVDRIAYKSVTFGFFTLTLGIVTGALWAQAAWGHYWNWDPKETWSLITWLVYASYLHLRVMRGWQGRWANRLLIAGFVSILFTFLGVNFLAQSLHSYRW